MPQGQYCDTQDFPEYKVGLNWLVTGGCGFLGVNLAESLRAEGTHKVIALDNLSIGTREALGAVVPFREIATGQTRPFDLLDSECPFGLILGDILDADSVAAATVDADVVVHLAANTGVQPSIIDPRADMETNVVGTFNCLEAARRSGVGRFVFASSGAPVGEVEPPIHEELAPHPVSPYGASKLAGEGYCSAYARSFDVNTVCLRFGNVYGPRSSHKGSVVAKFIRQALADETLEVFGDGLQTRDFIFVDDLVSAIIAAGTQSVGKGEAYQIATHSETSIRELLELLQAAFDEIGLNRPKVVFTEPLVGDVRRNFSDTTKARTQLAWEAQTPLAEGLAITLRSVIASQQS